MSDDPSDDEIFESWEEEMLLLHEQAEEERQYRHDLWADEFYP